MHCCEFMFVVSEYFTQVFLGCHGNLMLSMKIIPVRWGDDEEFIIHVCIMKSFIVKVTENQLYIKVLRNGNNADCLLDCTWLTKNCGGAVPDHRVRRLRGEDSSFAYYNKLFATSFECLFFPDIMTNIPGVLSTHAFMTD